MLAKSESKSSPRKEVIEVASTWMKADALLERWKNYAEPKSLSAQVMYSTLITELKAVELVSINRTLNPALFYKAMDALIAAEAQAGGDSDDALTEFSMLIREIVGQKLVILS